MSQIKTTNLLFRSRSKEKLRLVDANIGTTGAKGIKSLCRSSLAENAAAKYSTIAYILDKIFIDHGVQALQSDTSVYVKFTHKEQIYEGIFNGSEINWVSNEPGDYTMLIPVLVYTLSDLFTGENADELKGYFEELKTSKENVDKNVLLLCDAFYYAYAKKEENENIISYSAELSRATIERGIANNVYQPIPAFKGLTVDLKPGTATEAEPELEPEEDYMVHYDGWDEEQKMNIIPKSFLDTFVMTDETKAIAKTVKYRMDKVLKRMEKGCTGLDAIGSDYVNILMVGRPSTGKTTVAQAISAMTGLPIYTVPFSKHTEEDTFEGKNKVVEGKIGFVETSFLKAYEHGGIIMCEEINLADPGVVMGAMGQAIEKPFILMKDGYVPIRRHPLCIIMGAMNTGTAGSKQLNQALSSRFKCTYTLDDPDRNTFINILASKGYKKANCRKVHDAYDKILKFLKDPRQSLEELSENITLRGCFGALECMEEGQSYKEALNHTLVGKIAEVDLEAANQVKESVIDSLPDR